MGESWLLLGAPGVGKSTFSYNLKAKCSNVKQFSVRLHTENILSKRNELGRYLIENNIVQPKKHMPNPVVELIFSDYLDSVNESDFLLIEGFPINDEQFYGMLRQLQSHNRVVDGILILEDSYEAILERIKKRRVCIACEKKNGGGIPIPSGRETCPFCGGKLSKRPEDDIDFFNVRYKMFLDEKKNICKWFDSKIIHEINVSSTPLSSLCKEWEKRILYT